MPQKLDLDLTILTVAEQQRGGGSHVRANNEQNFLPQLPQIHTTKNTERQHTTLPLLGDMYLERDEKMFQMRKAIRLRQDRLQKQMNMQNVVVDQDKLKKMSPRQRTEFEKVIFEEWTVEGRQETLEQKPDENQKKLV